MARSRVYPIVLELVGSARLARLFEVIELGSNEFALVVEAAGDVDSNRRRRATVLGREQSHGAGILAARVVEQLIQDDLPAGVYHSHQVIDAGPIVADRRERGYRLSRLGASPEATGASSPS